MTPVIFKLEPGGDVLAVFPAMAGTYAWQRDCGCYAHVGQHGAADVDYASTLKPAKPAQYAALKAELERIGYDDLVIRRRFSRSDTDARREQCR